VSESRAPHHNGPPAQARVTIYWDSYNQDPELIEKARLKHRETCRRSFDALPHHKQLRPHTAKARGRSHGLFLAACAEAGTAAPRAAHDAAAARDAARALAAASRAAAPLEDAAGAAPVRPIPSLRDDEAVASSSAPRASSGRAVAATVSSAPTPAVASSAQSDGDVEMLDARRPSAASAPPELADDVLARLDDEEVQEALAAAGEESAAPDAFDIFVDALDRPTFRRALSLMLRGLYATVTERIQLQCQFQKLDRPAAAAVAHEYGYGLAPEEVRASAPCPLPSSVDASRDTPVVARTSALARVTVARRAGR
jgi:hypothetical protein